MPYDMRNPGMEKKYDFGGVDDCLNHIVTSFKAYDMWSGEAEKCAVRYDFRGLGRMHEKLGERAHCDAAHIGKKAADHPYGIITMPAWADIARAGEMGYFKAPELMMHLNKWDKYMKESRELFTSAAWYLAECREATLYRCLLDYVAQLENEIWAIEVIIDRITPDNYQHPDTKAVFKRLHCYFHDDYKGGKIDFDL